MPIDILLGSYTRIVDRLYIAEKSYGFLVFRKAEIYGTYYNIVAVDGTKEAKCLQFWIVNHL